METPNSPGRRTLLKAGALTLATPVIGAFAQTAPSHKEAATFNLWVISDAHVGTDKAASEAILHGLVGFKPPPIYPESLAEALRQSENGGAFGGPPIPWEIALNLGDYAGFWDAPEDEQGREVIRQYAVLKQHRREQIYNIAGNHDASPFGAPSGEGKETNWWFRKWADPVGEHTETSGVDPAKRRVQQLLEIKHGSMRSLEKQAARVVKIAGVRGRKFDLRPRVGQFDGAHTHQLGHRRLRVCIRPHQPC